MAWGRVAFGRAWGVMLIVISIVLSFGFNEHYRLMGRLVAIFYSFVRVLYQVVFLFE